VTELGKISLDFPKKAQEIKTGAFNTVHPGNFIFVESTAKGRGGVFFELCEAARKDARCEARADADLVEAALLPVVRRCACALTKEDAKQGRHHEGGQGVFRQGRARDGASSSAGSSGRGTSRRKRRWGQDEGGVPVDAEEPFEVPLEGAYFGKEMVAVRKEGRIQRLPWMPLPVHSYWDLGHSDYTSIWLHQHVWPWNHFLRYYQNSGEKLAHYAGWLQRSSRTRAP
jgi:hypothetical protein